MKLIEETMTRLDKALVVVCFAELALIISGLLVVSI